MKEVCRETGLTDKAVRFYIQNGLLAPRYTENYNGRKNFDFSAEDVDSLCDILQENREPDEWSLEEQLQKLWRKGKKKLPCLLAAALGGLLLAAGVIVALTLALSQLLSNAL